MLNAPGNHLPSLCDSSRTLRVYLGLAFQAVAYRCSATKNLRGEAIQFPASNHQQLTREYGGNQRDTDFLKINDYEAFEWVLDEGLRTKALEHLQNMLSPLTVLHANRCACCVR